MNANPNRKRPRRLAPATPALPLAASRDRRSFLLPLAGNAYQPSREMRRPGAPAPAQEEPLLPPALAVLALTRLGFGPTAGELAAFNALGGTDLQRLTAWVDLQLAPAALPDTACDARLATSGFSTLDKTLTQLFLDHHVADPSWEERIRPATETELATWIRAVYSKRQLYEVLADFWHNHFNVYAWEFIEAPVWVHYDRDVIRGHALGNFRQMLEAVAKSPAMLV